MSFVIGLDFGTDSVRAIIADCSNGKEIASSVFYYPRWKQGLYCDASANQWRHHPLDYIEGIENTIRDCVQQAGTEISSNIKAIGVDTTGSTPIAVDKHGTPLTLIKEFSQNPNAMFLLWKDHTAVNEAAEINEHATKFKTNYLKYVGGIYSSEWYWAKLLHILREDKSLHSSIYSFVELCDWVPFLLTGGKNFEEIKRGVCAAGHKALWSEEWNGLPPDDFFTQLDPLLKEFSARAFKHVLPSDQSAGNIAKEWADKLGLPADIIIAVGAFDAHMGAVGGQIEPYYLSRVMGTSTCDILVAPSTEINEKLVKGICGQVNGSVIPGMTGLEAGQSAFGDAYKWYSELVSVSIEELSEAASKIEVTEESELAIDWFNGRRTPDANQRLKGAFINLNLGSTPPALFRAVAESTCFGARAIIERFIEEKIPVKGLIGLGGVAKKSPFIMQLLADVTQMPIKIHSSEQTCALGAAMFAATAANIFSKVEDAMNAMGQGFEKTYTPNAAKAAIYNKRYQQYLQLGQFLS